jgi:DNA-binding beta-propeller fold protein YncE
VTTLAGTAGVAGGTDGKGAAARFGLPVGIAVDRAGYVYVADDGFGTLRKVAPDGTTTTFAGVPGAMGIGLGTTPRFSSPRNLAIAGDAIVVSDANAVLLLHYSAR